MFRVPGTSRQPAGILASSPQLMEAAQRNLLQPATVQGPLTGVGPDMFGVQRRQVSAVTAPPPAALSSDVLPESKPPVPSKPEDFGKVDQRSASMVKGLVDNLNEQKTATDNILKGVPSRNDAIIGGKSINQLYGDLEEKMGQEAPALKDYNLADFEDLAMESLGYKKGELGPSEVADKDRRTSFWLSLIKAGLATAAGESPYLLTNLARGLSFGVESFGKDLGDINQREREDNRAIASAKMDLMKDQRSVDTANRAVDIQVAQLKVQLAESIRGEAREDAYRKVDQLAQFTKMENDLFRFVNESNREWEKIDVQSDQFAQTLAATYAGQQPEIIRGMLMTPGYVEPATPGGKIDIMDPNSWILTEDGKELFDSWVKSKGTTKLTDLVQAADSAAQTMSVGLLDYSHLGDSGPAAARRAQLQIGKMGLSSDLEDQARALIGYGRATNASTSSPLMIEAILDAGNISGIDFYDNNGQKITAFQDDDGETIQLVDFDPQRDTDFLLQNTAYVIMGKAGQRTMATPE
tara:strand:+ start:1796 stop:3367 length:1572 start_codon:yes stop_codon:yes gene_type:complete